MSSHFKVLSLFSGAGGLDYGFEAAGFKTAAALELNHDACDTLRANRNWNVLERDIATVPGDELLEIAGLKRKQVDVLIGGPPCQPFSKAGYWATGDARRLNDPRSRTLDQYMRIVEETLPRTFMLENVSGLGFSGKSEGLDLLQRRIREINKRTRSNYRPHVRLLHAEEYGVPQRRHRLILIASRDGAPFAFPSPTHGKIEGAMRGLQGFGLSQFRTAWDAIGNCVPRPEEDLEVRGKWSQLLPSIPEGQNYLFHTERGDGKPLFGWRRRYWSFLLKLAKNQPAWTIQAQPGPAIGPFHWENRKLSVQELCRLQTFPRGLVICGNRASVQKQLGNAVPSLLAEVLALEIATQLLGKRRISTVPKLLPPVRSPMPGPKQHKQVPSAFLSLQGRHAAHPGTGLGRGALSRFSD